MGVMAEDGGAGVEVGVGPGELVVVVTAGVEGADVVEDEAVV